MSLLQSVIDGSIVYPVHIVVEFVMLTNESNMSKFERRMRFITGTVIWLLYLSGSITGGVSHFMAVIGVVLISTAIMNFCPYYLVFEFSSNKKTLS